MAELGNKYAPIFCVRSKQTCFSASSKRKNFLTGKHSLQTVIHSLGFNSRYTFALSLIASGVQPSMEDNKHFRRDKTRFHKRKNAGNRIVDRLTYNPARHKQRKTKELRQKLQKKSLPSPKPVKPSSKMKFGSFNVNGLSVDASWAVQQLLKDRDFDVRSNKIYQEI